MKLHIVLLLVALLGITTVYSAPVCCQNCGGNSISVLEDVEEQDVDILATNGECHNRNVCKIDCDKVLASTSSAKELSRKRFLEFNGNEMYEMEVFNGACLGTRFRKSDEYDNLLNKYFTQVIASAYGGNPGFWNGKVIKWVHSDSNGRIYHRSDTQDQMLNQQIVQAGAYVKFIPNYRQITCSFTLWNEFLRSLRDFCQQNKVTALMISDEMTRMYTVLGMDSRLRNCGQLSDPVLQQLRYSFMNMRVELVGILSKKYAMQGTAGTYCDCLSVLQYIRVVRGGIGEALNFQAAMYRQCKNPQA